jgi:hypothetical protein
LAIASPLIDARAAHLGLVTGAHVAEDDATRLAYVEVLPDEQKAATVGFLVRTVSWFNSQGITCQRVLSDNGSAYRSRQ